MAGLAGLADKDGAATSRDHILGRPVGRFHKQEKCVMYLSNHGGGCCGMRHIYGFADCTDADLGRSLKDLPQGRCAEVCLTTYQKRTWHDRLKKRGFKYVYAFRNANSGNTVHIYLYASSERPIPASEGSAASSRAFFRIPRGQPGAGRFSSRPASAA